MTERVAVLGGGVAGLTAAHELAERGFAVTVYEARDRLGGKARSLPVPGSGTDGRGDLPAEHGFRFFPGFYRHVPDTMRRIGVDGHLVGAERVLLAQGEGRNELLTAAHLPESLEDFALVTRFVLEFATALGIPPHETAFFVERLLTLLTSCDERRLGQWELQSWWSFVDAEQRSPAFRKFLADGLTRTLVAARAREMSARTGGSILLQLLFDLTRAGGRADRVLDGPTSDVWIDPWAAHIEGLGAEIRRDAPVEGIQMAGGRIMRRDRRGRGGDRGPLRRRRAGRDHAHARRARAARRRAAAQAPRPPRHALDERRHVLPRRGRAGRPRARHLHRLRVGADLDLPAPVLARLRPRADRRRPRRGDPLGRRLRLGEAEPPARQDRDAVHPRRGDRRGLGAARRPPRRPRPLNVVRAFLDPAIEFPNPTEAANLEPLLVNTANSWADRPDAVTRIPNLFLASDYVRTHTDLATMEGANEAARRAVNGILEATGSSAPRCEIWPLREPAAFAPARALDRIRWKLFKRPAKPPLRVTADGGLEATGPVAAGLVRLGPLLRRLFG